MNEQLLKTSGADLLSSRKKLRKTLWGVASTSSPPPSPLYVRGLKCKGVMNMGGNVGRLGRGLLWDTSTRRSHSAQITSPRVVRKSCLIHRFLSPLLHEQIQIHRRYSILEKTCSCNRIKLNYQATKKRIHAKTSTLRL